VSRRALVAALLLGAPAAAHAYSELPRFAEPALDGGGEGRYFTGAPTDGHACDVCHGDGRAPQVTLTGLPEQLVAGKRYELSLAWPADGRDYSLALELVDAAGAHPAVTIPETVDQPATMRCTMPTGTVAAETVDLDGRRVVHVKPCGARTLSLSFTPSSDRDLYLGVGVVASDGRETPADDGVLAIRKTLRASAGGCSTGGQPPGGLVALVALGLVLRRRR
jgi:MYXO-CTERM domain-containing protein